MREIKFRAWDKRNNLMSKSIILGDEIISFPDRTHILISDCLKHYIELMQYTGLKDKNGKEIYEGDILKAHGEVVWNDVEFQWSCINLTWNDKREWHSFDYLTSEFEVIGNIYEDKK